MKTVNEFRSPAKNLNQATVSICHGELFRRIIAIGLLTFVVNLSPTAKAQPLTVIGPGSLFERVLGNDGNITVDPTDATAGPVTSRNQRSTTLGHWSLSVGGGISARGNQHQLLEAGATISSSQDQMKFGVTGNSADLRSSIGSSRFVSSWSAALRLDSPQQPLELKPESVYELSFYLDGANGLLDPSMNLFPYLSLSFADGAGINLDTDSGASSVNLLTALGQNQTSGYVTLDFVTGTTVDSGPPTIKIDALANVGTTSLQRNDQFLTISSFSLIENPIVPVPEPAPIFLVAAGGILLLIAKFRH